MKRLYTILSLIICTLSVYAQNNLFVLVDVSKSVKSADLISAKQSLTEILLGVAPSNSNVVGASIQDLSLFKIKTGDKISIVKFGNQQTTLNILPIPINVTSIPTDIYNAINSFPTLPTDNNTYYTLAKAKIAEYAKKNGITKYVLCIVSDENEDDFGPGGKPNYNSPYIQEMVDNFNTKTNQAKEDPAILVKINTSTQGFKLRFIPSVDVSNYNLPGGAQPAIIDSSDSSAEIIINSPPEAKKGKEHELKSEALNINWTCKGCPQGIKYTVVVSQYEGGTFKDSRKVDANTVAFKVPDGKFRIAVSSFGNIAASSDYTYIIVSTGGYSWLIFVLILIVGIAIGYYFWNKKRQKKIDVFTNSKTDDIFSNNSGGAASNNSSNSDYF